MSNYLINHAIKNVWCYPSQDKQLMIEPVRLTPSRGAKNLVGTLWEPVPLPSKNHLYHVYQLGQLPTAYYGVINLTNEWVSLLSVAQRNEISVDGYNEYGIKIPLSACWMLKQINGLVLFAVDSKVQFIDFKLPIFFRFYDNNYFTVRKLRETISYYGGLMVSKELIATTIAKYNELRTKKGYCELQLNGQQVGVLNNAMVSVGDYLELRYDTSVKRVVDLPLADLPAYSSTLDAKQKRLLHPGKTNDGINYRDDIDLYLLKKETNPNKFTGIYYHKNREDAMRMVTHQDYGVPSSYLESYRMRSLAGANPSTITVRMVIRDDGNYRELVNEHHRIRELYKLTDEQIINALTGKSAVLAEWTADALEYSSYTTIMRSTGENITEDLVAEAYGYNAVLKLMQDTPLKAVKTNGSYQVYLKPGQHQSAGIYEYSNEGVLLGTHHHVSGPTYSVKHPQCRFIEVMAGKPNDRLDLTRSETPVRLDNRYNYRFLTKNRSTGEIKDVTGTSAYTIKDNKVSWTINLITHQGMVLSDRYYLHNELTLPAKDGSILEIPFGEVSRVGDKVSINPLMFAMGSIDVWLNGYPLIQNLDWGVAGKKLVINNVKYLKESGNNKLLVRIYGFSNRELAWDKVMPYGFVKHGMIGLNGRHEAMDDQLVRIIADGIQLKDDGLVNGTPYQIQYPQPTLTGVTVPNLNDYINRSKVLDKKILDYMSKYYPEPTFTTPSAIPNLYPVVSPFIAAIFKAIRTGKLIVDLVRITDKEMDFMVSRYKHLLDADPASKAVDLNYITIRPHGYRNRQELTRDQFVFLDRVQTIYLKSQIDLSRYLIVK